MLTKTIWAYRIINFVNNFEANFIIKDMEEIYGGHEGRRRPVAESQYYEKMRNERNEQFAPNYGNNEGESSSGANFYSDAYRKQKEMESAAYQTGFVQQKSYSGQYGGDKYDNNFSGNNYGQF